MGGDLAPAVSRVFFAAMKRLTSPRASQDGASTRAAIAANLTAVALVLGLAPGCGAGRSAPRPAPVAVTVPLPGTDLGAKIELADADYGDRRYAEALERYREIHEAATADGLDALAGEAAAMVAAAIAISVPPGTPEAAEGDVWMERAEAASTDEDEGAWTRVLLARGLRSLRARDVERARGTFIYLYNYSSGANRPSRALEAAYMASFSSRGPEQVDWMRRALRAAQVVGDPEPEALLWVELGKLLDRDGDLESALEAFSKGRDMLAVFAPGSSERQRAELDVGRALWRAGRPQEACDHLERLRAIAQSQRVQDPSPKSIELLGSILEQLGEAHATLGEIERAREFFRGAQQVLGEAGEVLRASARARKMTECIQALDRPATGQVIPPKRR